jgi:hypothetical protein
VYCSGDGLTYLSLSGATTWWGNANSITLSGNAVAFLPSTRDYPEIEVPSRCEWLDFRPRLLNPASVVRMFYTLNNGTTRYPAGGCLGLACGEFGSTTSVNEYTTGEIAGNVINQRIDLEEGRRRQRHVWFRIYGVDTGSGASIRTYKFNFLRQNGNARINMVVDYGAGCNSPVMVREAWSPTQYDYGFTTEWRMDWTCFDGPTWFQPTWVNTPISTMTFSQDAGASNAACPNGGNVSAKRWPWRVERKV